jgi:hypothetical protein
MNVLPYELDPLPFGVSKLMRPFGEDELNAVSVKQLAPLAAVECVMGIRRANGLASS